MKKLQCIYEDGDHKWYIIARDPAKPDYVIDTNEYLVCADGESIILDPGGIEIFPAVFSAVCEVFDPTEIKTVFASHQDPDIISSLSMWMEANPALKCYISRLWSPFIPHFGGTDETFINIPDEGMDIRLGGKLLQTVPAHYLHSSGNFNIYDPKAKILFSGDIGTALVPAEMNTSLFVENFDEHIQYAEGFHSRWMGCEKAKTDWCERVSAMEIDMLCPQHGTIYKGDDVKRFIEWFNQLPIAVAV